MLQAALASVNENLGVNVDIVEFSRQAEIIVVVVEEPALIEDYCDVANELESALPWDSIICGWDFLNQCAPGQDYFNGSSMIFIVEAPGYDPIWEVL